MCEEKMLSRVQKLLALGDSPVKEEAEAAVAKAHELLAKHGLSMADVDTGEQKTEFMTQDLFGGKGNRPYWQRLLCDVISRHFKVQFILRKRYNSSPHFAIIGSKERVEVVSYTLNFLVSSFKSMADRYVNQQKRIRKQWEKENGKLDDREKIADMLKVRNSYYIGLVAGVNKKLEEQVAKEQEMGLVLVDEPGRDEYIKQELGGLKKGKATKRTSDINPNAYCKGVADGASLEIAPAIT